MSKAPENTTLTTFSAERVLHFFQLQTCPSDNPFHLQLLQDKRQQSDPKLIDYVEHIPPSTLRPLSPANSGSLIVHLFNGAHVDILDPLQALAYDFAVNNPQHPFFHIDLLPTLHLGQKAPLIIPLSPNSPSLIPPATLNPFLTQQLPNIPPSFINQLEFSLQVQANPQWAVGSQPNNPPYGVRTFLKSPSGPLPVPPSPTLKHPLRSSLWAQEMDPTPLLAIVHFLIFDLVVHQAATHVPLYQQDFELIDDVAYHETYHLFPISTSKTAALSRIPYDTEEVYLFPLSDLPCPLEQPLSYAELKQLPLLNWNHLLEEHVPESVHPSALNISQIVQNITATIAQHSVQQFSC